MITWTQFCESRDKEALEKEEEKLGKDLDGDGEKGESPAHKKKVLGKKPKSMATKKTPKKLKKA